MRCLGAQGRDVGRDGELARAAGSMVGCRGLQTHCPSAIGCRPQTPPRACLAPSYLSTGIFNEAAGREDPAPVPAPEFHSALARLLHAHGGPHYVSFVDAAEGSGEGAGAGGGPLAAARGIVEAGRGRLLEVRVEGEAQLLELQASLRCAAGGLQELT